LKKRARGDDEHRDIDQAGERHRDHDVDACEPEEAPRLLLGLRQHRSCSSAECR